MPTQEEIFLLALSGLAGVTHVAKLSKLLDPSRKKEDDQQTQLSVSALFEALASKNSVDLG